MVAEADESDRSFLKLFPSIAVMTNIDREHMEAYGSFDDLLAGVRRVRQQGAVLRRGVVACADDPELMALRPRFTRRVVTYGLTRDDVDVTRGRCRARGIWQHLHGRAPPAPRRGRRAARTLRLQVPGRHSVQNALAAVAVGLELDVPFADDRRRARRVPGRRAPLPALRRGQRHSRDRRLWPSPDGDCGGAGGRARRASGPRRRRVSAASLHAHPRSDARVRPRARRRRRSGADRHLRGERRPDPGDHGRSAGGGDQYQPRDPRAGRDGGRRRGLGTRRPRAARRSGDHAGRRIDRRGRRRGRGRAAAATRREAEA